MIDPHPSRSDLPRSMSDFVAIMDKAARYMDQMLGYRGHSRYVAFYYEPRGEEVVWRDCDSYGYSTGAWSTFLYEVGPLAEHYKVDVGCSGTSATHALLIDRVERRAYFTEREEAVRFLTKVGQTKLADGSSSTGIANWNTPIAIVEITTEAITVLAHQIWERKGRPQGQDLQDWLEAEAELKAAAQRQIKPC